jgi:hypothetical protein
MPPELELVLCVYHRQDEEILVKSALDIYFCYSHVVVDVQAVMDRLSLASLACGVFNPAPAVVELTTETAPANISCFRLLKCALFGMVKCSPALRVSVVVNSFVIERVGFCRSTIL